MNTDTLLIDRLEQLLKRMQTYPWWVVAVELATIWFLVYIVIRFLRGTRGARVIKGVALILIIGTLSIKVLGSGNSFERLNFLYSNFHLVVVSFQGSIFLFSRLDQLVLVQIR